MVKFCKALSKKVDRDCRSTAWIVPSENQLAIQSQKAVPVLEVPHSIGKVHDGMMFNHTDQTSQIDNSGTLQTKGNHHSPSSDATTDDFDKASHAETSVYSGFASASAALHGPFDPMGFPVALTSGSVNEAALAFQKWRNFHLKTVFSRELKKVLEEAQRDEARLSLLEEEIERKGQHLAHALAESAQLRAHLCEVDDTTRTADVENLQKDLLKALERASSSEAEVERYNREIRKLRERVKCMEDEASRLDLELKANVSLLRKDKDGLVEENRILLEQLARRDEEVLSQAQEIGRLKSALACMKKYESELERFKVDLQQKVDGAQHAKHKPQGSVLIQEQMKQCLQCYQGSVSEAQLNVEEHPIFMKLLDHVQHLITCLQENEKSSQNGVHNSGTQERLAIKLNRNHKEAMYPYKSHQLYSRKHVNQASHPSCKKDQLSINDAARAGTNVSNDHDFNFPRKERKEGFKKKYLGSKAMSNDRKLDLLPAHLANTKKSEISKIIYWKWRWATAASKLKALSRESTIQKSNSKSQLIGKISVAPLSFTPGHEKFRCSMQKVGSRNIPSMKYCKEKDKNISFMMKKLFSLLLSVWKTSSRSVKLEKEMVGKDKQLYSLMSVIPRWVQKNFKRRMLERTILHWILYVLRSQRAKHEHHPSYLMPCSCMCTCLHRSTLASLSLNMRKSADNAQVTSVKCKSHEMDGHANNSVIRQTSNNPKRIPFAAKANNPCVKLSGDAGCTATDDGGNAALHTPPKCDVELAHKKMDCSKKKCNGLVPSALCTVQNSIHICRLNACKTQGLEDYLMKHFRKSQKQLSTFSEKAMQVLKVSLHCKLWDLEELIVNGPKAHHLQEIGDWHKCVEKSNSRVFCDKNSTRATSLWNICYELGQCLNQAHNRILLSYHGINQNAHCMPFKMETQSDVRTYCSKSPGKHIKCRNQRDINEQPAQRHMDLSAKNELLENKVASS